METIHIEISLPGNNTIQEFSVPSQVPVGCYLGELMKVINQYDRSIDLDEKHPLLIDVRHRCAIDLTKTLAESHIRDSDRLLLI